jgi:hypothetical protein
MWSKNLVGEEAKACTGLQSQEGGGGAYNMCTMYTQCEQQKVCILFLPPVRQMVWTSERSPRCSVPLLHICFVSLLGKWYLINICHKKQHMTVYGPLLVYVQTNSGAHPAFYSTSTEDLACVCSGQGVMLITRLHLPPGLRTVAPPICFHSINGNNLHAQFPINV